MAFDTLEGSRADGAPVLLYEFQTGATTYLRFTDASTDIVDGPDTYTKIPIDITTVNTSGSLDNSETRITMPVGVGLDDLYFLYPPDIPVTVVVRAGHVGDTEYKMVFTGTVLSCSWEDGNAVFACEPVTAALRRVGLRRPWSLTCPYALFKGNCTASKVAATTQHVVQSLDNTNITMLAGWNGAFALENYNTGLVEWPNTGGGTTSRTIIRALATQISLSGPTTDLTALDTVDVILGCNRQMDNCEILHNVIRDFGGQSFIPTENPWESQSYFR